MGTGFMFANLNILNNKECEELLKHQNQNSDLDWNKDYELCAGKKHQFPKSAISFEKVKKKAGVKTEEIRQAKQCINYNFITLYNYWAIPGLGTALVRLNWIMLMMFPFS